MTSGRVRQKRLGNHLDVLLLTEHAHHERVFHEIEVDQKLVFLRGTYG